MNYSQKQVQDILTNEAIKLAAHGHKFTIVIGSPDGQRTKTLNLSLEQVNAIQDLLGE